MGDYCVQAEEAGRLVVEEALTRWEGAALRLQTALAPVGPPAETALPAAAHQVHLLLQHAVSGVNWHMGSDSLSLSVILTAS